MFRFKSSNQLFSFSLQRDVYLLLWPKIKQRKVEYTKRGLADAKTHHTLISCTRTHTKFWPINDEGSGHNLALLTSVQECGSRSVSAAGLDSFNWFTPAASLWLTETESAGFSEKKGSQNDFKLVILFNWETIAWSTNDVIVDDH